MSGKRAAMVAIAMLLIAGCSKQGHETNNLAGLDTRINGNVMIPADENAAANNGVAPMPTPDTGARPSTDTGRDIPPMLRGRWGMVAADCTSTHGDAKGLLEISGTVLNFYESRGTLKQIEEHEPSRIRANFSFEGEGMSWTRDMTLDVQDEGKTLIRREYGQDAAPGPLRYRRCKD